MGRKATNITKKRVGLKRKQVGSLLPGVFRVSQGRKAEQTSVKDLILK